MTKNWKLIAEGAGVPLNAEELDKVAALDALFRPLVAMIPLEVEPAITLSEEAIDPR